MNIHILRCLKIALASVIALSCNAEAFPDSPVYIKKGPVVSAMPVNERAGVVSWGSKYFSAPPDWAASAGGQPSGDQVYDSALVALKCIGSKVIKLNMNKLREAYPLNAWADSYPDIVSIAKTESFKRTFALPFSTFILGCFTQQNGENQAPVDWFDGMSAAETAKVEKQFYDFTEYLISTYKGTGKNFVLQNWESDGALQFYWDTYGDKAIQGMIDWFNARQNGIDRARAGMGETDVGVYGAVEVNRVLTAYGRQPRVTTAVLPYTHSDLYSWSNYDAHSQRSIQQGRDLIKKYAPDSAAFGSDNLYMGEYGWATNDPLKDTRQKETVQATLEGALACGFRWVMYWELMCNEFVNAGAWAGIDLTVTKPANADMRGYWLVKPDGSTAAAYDYLKGKMR